MVTIYIDLQIQGLMSEMIDDKKETSVYIEMMMIYLIDDDKPGDR